MKADGKRMDMLTSYAAPRLLLLFFIFYLTLDAVFAAVFLTAAFFFAMPAAPFFTVVEPGNIVGLRDESFAQIRNQVGLRREQEAG